MHYQTTFLEHALPIRELTDPPRARLDSCGAEALSDAELVAIITGAPSLECVQRLLIESGGLVGLRTYNQTHPTLGPGRMARLRAAVEIGLRVVRSQAPDRIQVKSPDSIADRLMLEMAHLDQEHLRTVLLDTKNRIQTISTVYVGSLNTSMVRVGEVFKEAIRRNSAAIIVSHNHPSGDATPSPEDVLVTREIVAAGKLLDIEVLDHIVVGHMGWVSLRSRGLGFDS